MASPQAEDGHIDIAHEIAEALMKTNISSYQTRILWAIWRQTYGWHKKEDWISNSKLIEMTGLAKGHVSRTVKELLSRRMIIKDGKRISFQKDYEKWIELPKKSHSKKLPIGDIKVTNRGNKLIDDTGNKNNNEQKLPIGVTDQKVTNRGNDVTNRGNKKLPIGEDTKEIKRNYTKEKYIYSARRLFDLWNSLEIIQHREIDKFMPRLLAKLKIYSENEIKEAMQNYKLILSSEEYIFTYRWGLDDFLGRKNGFDKFLSINNPFENYRVKSLKTVDDLPKKSQIDQAIEKMKLR